MRIFKNISIRSKQTLVIMLTSSVVLLLACSAFVAHEVFSFRRNLVNDVRILAEVVGNNCAAAVDFNDPRSAADTLSALRANQHIISAAVYGPNGEIFAVYHRDEGVASIPPFAGARGHEFAENRLNLFGPIEPFGAFSGTIYLASDLRLLWDRLLRYMGIAGAVFLASLLLAFVLSHYVQQLVSGPILHLAQVVRAVAQDRNYGVRAKKKSDDELGQLMDGFNEMLDQIQVRDNALEEARETLEKRVGERTRELEITHRQLVDASRLGGMAEIATNVLHNVGNVLNSVNISANLIRERVRDGKAAGLDKVAALVREHEEDLGAFMTEDPRGKHLPAYLTQLASLVKVEQEEAVTELDSLRQNIEHIKEIVATQQNFARGAGVAELVDVRTLVEESLRMNASALARHRVEVRREFADVAPMQLEKHKVIQILVNLVRNAKHACDESGREDKALIVRVANGAGHIAISVCDNGVGIPQENLTRIFNHGFTTRKDGHGFGLHSSALAAKGLGGSLRACSDGPGQGAVFTLELPIPSTHICS